MNAAPTSVPQARSRRYRLWLYLGLTVLVAPLVVLAVVAVSLLTLDRPAGVLREELMAATAKAHWDTKVQLSAGGLTLGALRTGLRFVQAEHMAEARLALAAVRRASVGVYESAHETGGVTSADLIDRTDRRMQARGWNRLIAVTEPNETVLIYATDQAAGDGRIDLCLAVLDGTSLVVVSTQVDAASAGELVKTCLPKQAWREQLRLARL